MFAIKFRIETTASSTSLIGGLVAAQPLNPILGMHPARTASTAGSGSGSGRRRMPSSPQRRTALRQFGLNPAPRRLPPKRRRPTLVNSAEPEAPLAKTDLDHAILSIVDAPCLNFGALGSAITAPSVAAGRSIHSAAIPAARIRAAFVLGCGFLAQLRFAPLGGRPFSAFRKATPDACR